MLARTLLAIVLLLLAVGTWPPDRRYDLEPQSGLIGTLRKDNAQLWNLLYQQPVSEALGI